nr:holo-ACP synthase [Campylobacterota bacterium]
MIGIDIVNINRFEKFLDRFPDKALQRFLSPQEISLVGTSTQRAAGFFAAKEAISKALGTGISKECAFYDIIIHKDENNAPFFTLSTSLVEKYKIVDSALSITHDSGFAIAVADIKSDCKRTTPLC